MGDPRRLKKKYKTPAHPWQKERILEELGFLGIYGLRNKREFWISKTIIGNFRNIARESRTFTKEKAAAAQKVLIKKLNRLGLLGPEASLEDVLLLTAEDVLKRRLQTFVYEKGLARSIHQARQMIVHGHICVGEKRIDAPSYIVQRDEEDLVRFAPSSPFISRELPETKQKVAKQKSE